MNIILSNWSVASLHRLSGTGSAGSDLNRWEPLARENEAVTSASHVYWFSNLAFSHPPKAHAFEPAENKLCKQLTRQSSMETSRASAVGTPHFSVKMQTSIRELCDTYCVSSVNLQCI